MAVERASNIGKQLIVIGDPYNGPSNATFGCDYQCGDICVDITGCPKCNNGIKTKLEDIIDKIDLSQYVVYVSCVLEYVEDIDKILFKSYGQ
jgi:hypothetical protein